MKKVSCSPVAEVTLSGSGPRVFRINYKMEDINALDSQKVFDHNWNFLIRPLFRRLIELGTIFIFMAVRNAPIRSVMADYYKNYVK